MKKKKKEKERKKKEKNKIKRIKWIASFVISGGNKRLSTDPSELIYKLPWILNPDNERLVEVPTSGSAPQIISETDLLLSKSSAMSCKE